MAVQWSALPDCDLEERIVDVESSALAAPGGARNISVHQHVPFPKTVVKVGLVLLGVCALASVLRRDAPEQGDAAAASDYLSLAKAKGMGVAAKALARAGAKPSAALGACWIGTVPCGGSCLPGLSNSKCCVGRDGVPTLCGGGDVCCDGLCVVKGTGCAKKCLPGMIPCGGRSGGWCVPLPTSRTRFLESVALGREAESRV